MASEQEVYRHKEWLGLIQPVGLVVSPLALHNAQAFIEPNKTLIEIQQKLQSLLIISTYGNDDEKSTYIEDFPLFTREILNWTEADLIDSDNLPPELEEVLPDYGETLRPTYGVQNNDKSWLMLIQCVKTQTPLDETNEAESSQGWKASVQAKFERLLRYTQIPIGILFNGTEIRLVYAPRGESSGHLTFPVKAMTEVSGRLILGALYMLIGSPRLFTVPSLNRLPAILSQSREYQSEVSTKLANQVLDALWELLRGFQVADASSNGNLLREVEKNPQHIYGGLLTVLMRLVFILYAEDKGLMPNDDVYQQYYSITGLYEKLREDDGSYPDTMEQRFGAWACLLSLFRLVYDGGGSVPDYLPARHGQLFNPDEYPFLEGRELGTQFQVGEIVETPGIPDGVIYRILHKLLILDGEQLSYRALDVEQIGSVYEAIMGFDIQLAQGISIALKPKDIVINIEDILKEKAENRRKTIEAQAECKLTDKEASGLKQAKNPNDLIAALKTKISNRTPNSLPQGSLFLQPGEERRRSGSHYTPRKLTQPVVETTLRPVLEELGEHAKAEQLLNLKVCDLAMGSGAFLVEACRQLADRVVESWTRDGEIDNLPDDVEPLLAARRLVAQRCIYGVDKNPFAVNLAKLSLWLVTLAKDRPFTFVDHALKCGDSLVGVTWKDIDPFGKILTKDMALHGLLKLNIHDISRYRQEIQERDAKTDEEAEEKVQKLKTVDKQLEYTRLIGDTIIASFFDAKNKKECEEKRKEYKIIVADWLQGLPQGKKIEQICTNLKYSDSPVMPFHWEIEFPEVFNRENPGFDAIVGNPPFAGKNTAINGNHVRYMDWLKELHLESHGNSDLVAHFFRRAFSIICERGCFGLIATNTISQGDTRSTGLRFICNNGGMIYNANKRFKWPGIAAVVISIVNIYKGNYSGIKTLDSRPVNKISAFLFPRGGNENPKVLLANSGKSFQGSIVLGMGFTFDDSNPEATPIVEMHKLIEKDPRNQECIFPYIGGEEVNTSPTHAYHRYVINFGEMTEDEARKYPDLMAIVEEKVKPQRLIQKREIRARYWWRFGETTPKLVSAIAQSKLERVLVIPCGATAHIGFTFLLTQCVFSNTLAVFTIDKFNGFSILQSRIHEIWARFFSSTLGDGLRYTPSDCFETFPFPENWENNSELEEIGKTYYEYRASLMVQNNEGLTKTYNRFHDPYEIDDEILKLRQLHSQLDDAVFKAYGWNDIDNICGFTLDYIDEDTKNFPQDVQSRIESGDIFFATSSEACHFDSVVKTGKRKLPWKYKWSSPTHDEVLARLLDLNQNRYEEEVIAGKKEMKKPTARKTKTKAEKNPSVNLGPLFTV